VSLLYQILEDAANHYPDDIALVFQSHQISYQKLKNAADRLASGIKNLGLKAGDRVAVMLPNVPHFPISYFALLKLGISMIPVSTLYKTEEIHHQLEDSEVKGIIYWEGFRSNVAQAVQNLEHCRNLIVLGDKAQPGEVRLNYLIENNEPLLESADLSQDDTALIVYTAGTTGRPKGAELTHQNISSNITACSQLLKLDSHDSVLSSIPLYHPLGFTLSLSTFMYVGAKIILELNYEAGHILHCIHANKPTYIICVPSMIRALLEVESMDEIDTGSLKYCLSNGDSLKQEIIERFESKFKTTIIEGYGLTEASPMVSFNDSTQNRHAGSIGLPLPGVEIRIVDENDREVRTGEVGEILVRGPNVMKGYLNRPEATKEVIRDGWLRTGDLARVDESGFAFIEARKKNVIMKGGFSIYPKEVERFLTGFPKIEEAVVVGIEDRVHGEEIHAFVVLKKDEQATEEEILTYIKERMANYKCPKEIHFVSSFPRDIAGRIQRDKIKRQYLNKDEKAELAKSINKGGSL